MQLNTSVKRTIFLPFETEPFLFRHIGLPLADSGSREHDFPFKTGFELSASARLPRKPAPGEGWG